MSAANFVPVSARRIPDSTREARAQRLLDRADDLVPKLLTCQSKASRWLHDFSVPTDEAMRNYRRFARRVSVILVGLHAINREVSTILNRRGER